MGPFFTSTRDVFQFRKCGAHPGQWLTALGGPDEIQVAQTKKS